MPFLPDLKEIKRLRRKLGISQSKLALELKIPQANISRIENSKGNPSYLTVKKIFNHLEHEGLNRKKTKKIAENIMTRKIISINSMSSIKDAVDLMNKHNLSQIPIIDESQNIGCITSKKIQKIIIDNPAMINSTIEIIKELPFPEIEENWDIKDVSNLLTNYSAVLVKKNNIYSESITDADLLKF